MRRRIFARLSASTMKPHRRSLDLALLGFVEPPNSAARRQFKGIRAGREAGNPLRPLPEQPGLTWSCHSLLHAMPCSIRAQARSLTMGRHAAPLAQRQRDVALELAVASDRALDKLLLAFEPRCRVPSAGETRFAVLGPHPRAANVCRRRSQLLLRPGSCSAPHDQPW